MFVILWLFTMKMFILLNDLCFVLGDRNGHLSTVKAAEVYCVQRVLFGFIPRGAVMMQGRHQSKEIGFKVSFD